MAQVSNFNIPANLSGTAFRAQTIKKLTALLTQNSGATEPPNPQGGMIWLDTADTKTHYLKLRNSENNAWGVICEIDVGTGAIKNGYSTKEIDTLLKSKLSSNDIETSNVINKGVKRDGSGRIWTGYINTTINNDSASASTSSFLIFRNTDGYLRQMNQAKLREVLNVYTKAEVNSLTANTAKTNATNTFGVAQIFNGELSGSALSSVNGANKVVKRDANGDFAGRHITASHFNMTQAVQDSLANVSSQLIFKNTDNYLRAMTLSKLKEFITASLQSSDGVLLFRTASFRAAAATARESGIRKKTTAATTRIAFAKAFPTACIGYCFLSLNGVSQNIFVQDITTKNVTEDGFGTGSSSLMEVYTGGTDRDWSKTYQQIGFNNVLRVFFKTNMDNAGFSFINTMTSTVSGVYFAIGY